ncbi:hypothetical protein CRE_31099 [Caenorhabditis remanei]|uniref:Uncharacterized protein n=1 Tax=Caenorhabditis remanei TaxID=31234 RepID=E3LUM1_CAERE|nr:hypothetical protein CRE_31099 [Caenorhabditis remanei]
MFPNLPTLPSNPIFSGFAPILSQFPLFASLVPRPPQRDHVITTGKCAGGEIKIVTVFPWKNTTVNRNMGHMDYELSRLQKYSGISTNEFCPEITKTPVQHNSNFAVIYRFPYLTSTCDRLRLFVRNAVSWSSEVSRARVACECDKTVELIRG